MPVSNLTVALEQHPSGTGSDRLLRLETGTDRVMEAPDGMMTVSVFTGSKVGLGVCARTIEGGLDEGAAVVGTACCEAIASCKRQRTSSAEAKSIGTCPS